MADLTGNVQIPVILTPSTPFVIPLSQIFGDTYTIYGIGATGVTVSVSDFRLYPSEESDAELSPLLPLLRVNVGAVHQILPIGRNANNSGDDCLTFVLSDDLRSMSAASFSMILDTTTLGPYIPIRYAVLDGDFEDGRIGSLGDNGVIYINETGTEIGVIQGGAANATLQDVLIRGPSLGVDFTVSGRPLEATTNATEKTVRVTIDGPGTPLTAVGTRTYGTAVTHAVNTLNTYPASAQPDTVVEDITTFRDWVLDSTGGAYNQLSPASVSYAIPRWASHRPVCAMILLRFSISSS